VVIKALNVVLDITIPKHEQEGNLRDPRPRSAHG